MCKVKCRIEAVSSLIQAKIGISFNYLDFQENAFITFIVRISTSPFAHVIKTMKF